METSRGDSKSRALTPLAPCPHGAACDPLRARLTTGRAFNVFQLIMFPPFVMDNSGSIDSAILAFNRKLTRVLSSNSITIALKSSSFANRTCLTVLPFKVDIQRPRPWHVLSYFSSTPPSVESKTQALQLRRYFGALAQ